MAKKTLTLAEFKVDLQELDDAIQLVALHAGYIEQRTATITTQLQGVASIWSSPAEIPFNDLQLACTRQMTNLTDQLTEMLTRMRTAYHNYRDAEQANLNNLHAHSHGNGTKHGAAHHGGGTKHGGATKHEGGTKHAGATKHAERSQEQAAAPTGQLRQTEAVAPAIPAQ